MGFEVKRSTWDDNKVQCEGIDIKKGYRLIIHNVDAAFIDKLVAYATDKTKPCITFEEEER